MAEFRYRKGDTFTIIGHNSLFSYRQGKCVLGANKVGVYHPSVIGRWSDETDIPLEAASLILSLWGHTLTLEPEPVDYEIVPKPEWGYKTRYGEVRISTNEDSARYSVSCAFGRKLIKFSS